MVELILLIGLFYPQLALVVGYLSNSLLPNNIPLWGDVLMLIFFPRLLFIVYIAMNMETLPYAEVWIIVHAIFLLWHGLENRILARLG